MGLSLGEESIYTVDAAWSKPGSPRVQGQGRGQAGRETLGRGQDRGSGWTTSCPMALWELAWAHPEGRTLGKGGRIWGADFTSIKERRAGLQRRVRKTSAGEGEVRPPRAGSRSGEVSSARFEGVIPAAAADNVTSRRLPEGLLAWKGGREPCAVVAVTTERSLSRLPAVLGNQDPVAPCKLLFSWCW